jgi:hypothetical protein
VRAHGADTRQPHMPTILGQTEAPVVNRHDNRTRLPLNRGNFIFRPARVPLPDADQLPNAVAVTSAKPQLNAYRCPPQCDRNTASCPGVGSSANRYAWITTPTSPTPPPYRTHDRDRAWVRPACQHQNDTE